MMTRKLKRKVIHTMHHIRTHLLFTPVTFYQFLFSQVRLSVQHRGKGDERQRPVALRHDLLRRDGVHLHLEGAQRDRDLRRDLGSEQAPGQPGQHPRADLSV